PLEPGPNFDRAALREIRGAVRVDGSSTVFPITELVAVAAGELAPDIDIGLGVSGTGGGFQRFCRGDVDIANASRPIKAVERELCAEHGVDYIEVPVAFDGVSVVVHADNPWASCMTLAELETLWRPEAEGLIERWSDVRRDWPGRPIQLYAPGRDSGTFDYFTRAVVGREGAARADFIGSEDDYLLAQDIAADVDAVGFFGFAYFREYRSRLRPVAVDAGAGCVEPTLESIGDGSYRPLSRPLFIYLATPALGRPAVEAFVELYLAVAPDAAERAGYVALPPRAYELNRSRVARMETGSLWAGGSQVGVSIERLLALESGSVR
ncbi:MAG: PstS family phosphate ABC transporter substrate-binding protein, partial [Acidobacteriota bacterium]